MALCAIRGFRLAVWGSCWAWLVAELAGRVESGRGTERDLELLDDVPGLVEGGTICAFADAAMWPVQGFMHHFRGDFEQHVREHRCPFPDSFEL